MKTKLIFEFNDEEQEEFRIQTQASAMYSVLWSIAQEMFRPARKHGYCDDKINKALEAADTVLIKNEEFPDLDVGAGSELISLLEKKFYEILRDYNVEIG